MGLGENRREEQEAAEKTRFKDSFFFFFFKGGDYSPCACNELHAMHDGILSSCRVIIQLYA